VPASYLSGPLHERKVRDLGIHFIKNLVDEVTYDRVAGCKRLRPSRRLEVG